MRFLFTVHENVEFHETAKIKKLSFMTYCDKGTCWTRLANRFCLSYLHGGTAAVPPCPLQFLLTLWKMAMNFQVCHKENPHELQDPGVSSATESEEREDVEDHCHGLQVQGRRQKTVDKRPLVLHYSEECRLN